MDLGPFGKNIDSSKRKKKDSELARSDPTATYYLSAIHLERLDYNNAWYFYEKTKKIVEPSGHNPKALQKLKQALASSYSKK